MIKPTKYSHPDRTVMSVALILLVYLKKHRIKKYNTLYKYVKKVINGGSILFLPALDFLYIMGLIEYQQKTDSIEYVGKNETI